MRLSCDGIRKMPPNFTKWLAAFGRYLQLMGRVLSMAEYYGDYPCHRVVNHMGRLAPHFPEQRERLLAEGVAFRENGCVDMKKYLWDCGC